MPRYHLDEVAKLEDIEALLVTATDLADRFRNPEIERAARSIRTALLELRATKQKLVIEWREMDRTKN